MLTRQTSDLLAFLAICFGLLAFVAALAWVPAYIGCHSKWKDAGFDEVRFDFPGGCKVRRGQRWLPTSAIRDANL